LILTPGNPVQLAPLIDEAERDRNIRVVCVASDDSLSNRSTAISVEPRMNGMLAAELIAGFVPPASRVAVFTGSLATEDHAKKVGGFYEVFPKDCPGGKVVDVVEGHENEAKTLEICAALLRKEPKLAGLYVSTVNCLPVCRALQEAGRAGKVRVVATDLFAEAVPYFRNHTISASIYQRPYRQGQLAVRLIVDHFDSWGGTSHGPVSQSGHCHALESQAVPRSRKIEAGKGEWDIPRGIVGARATLR
jgi:LacI family transcriptional regulator